LGVKTLRAALFILWKVKRRAMRFLFALLTCLLLLSLCYPYRLNKTREELLADYQTNVDPRIPKSAKVLLGSERINVYFGQDVFGVETRNGELYYFETRTLPDPGIVVKVSNRAAEQMAKRKMGIMSALDSGEMTIEGKNLLSSLKIEVAKRIYAVSGGDDYLLGKKTSPSESAKTYNAVYISRTRIWN